MSTMEDPSLSRVPPQDVQAEVCTLGAMMLRSEARATALSMLKAEHFYRPANQLLFTTLAEMDAAGVAIDGVITRAKLIASGRLEQIGGDDYLYQILDGVPDASNVAFYAGDVRRHAVRRAVIVAAAELVQDAYDPGLSVEELMDSAEKRLLDIDPRLASGRGRDMGIADAVSAALIEAERAQESGVLVGVRSGIVSLDRVTAGFRPGENVVVAGRTGVGKSTLAICIALAAAQRGCCVVYVSAEMPPPQIGKRLVQMASGVWGSLIRNGQLRPEQWTALREAEYGLKGLPVYIVGRKCGVPEVATICRRAESRFRCPVGLVVLDYLQLLSPHEGKSRYEQVSAMSTAAKNLAIEQPCVVLTISQMDRASVRPTTGAKAHDPRPTIFGLKESGSIENDADFVLLMHAPADGRLVCPHDRAATEIWLRVGKGRETTTTPWPDEDAVRGLKLRWYPGLTRMADWGGPEEPESEDDA